MIVYNFVSAMTVSHTSLISNKAHSYGIPRVHGDHVVLAVYTTLRSSMRSYRSKIDIKICLMEHNYFIFLQFFDQI